jgi:hypothetical protein
MSACSVCGEAMPEGTRTCSVCGTTLAEPVPAARLPPAPGPRPAPANIPASAPPGSRYCPACGIVYGGEYTDAFCICGTELALVPAASPAPATAAPAPPIPQAPPALPPAGTPCLVMYGPDRRPVHYFALDKDAMLIGRLDAAKSNFPDIDLDEWLDAASARKLSRQHALILRSRATGSVSLRPLEGNTGTQIETEMVLPMNDYPLIPGQRVILGGVARFKFEIT